MIQVLGYIILMKEKQQGQRSFNQRLNKFPDITIPYPIFATLADKLQIPSSKSIAALLVKLITLSRVRYIEDVLKKVSQVGELDNFAGKMTLIYAVGLFALPIFMLQDQLNPKQISSNTKYALWLDNKLGQVELCFQAYSSRTQTEQHILSNIWSIINEEMFKYSIIIQNKTQDTLELRYDHPLYEEAARLPSLLRISSGQMELVYHYPWQVLGIQLSEYVLLMDLNKGSESDDFEDFVDNLANEMEKQLTADNAKERYYLMLGCQDIFISQAECFIVTINRQSMLASQWRLSRPSKMFNYYHYKVGDDMDPKARCDFWSLAIILLEIISIRTHLPRFRKQLKSCNTVEEVRICVNEFIQEIEENRLFLDNSLLAKIQGYLDVEEIQEQHILKQEQTNSIILQRLSLQSGDDDLNPKMFVLNNDKEEKFDYSEYQ